MNTTDLTTKQSTIFASLVADLKANIDTTGADQVARIADMTGMTKKAVDSMLRVLVTKGLVIRINGVWSLTLENIDCTPVSAELSHMTAEQLTEEVEAATDPTDQAKIDAAFAKMTAAVDFSDAKRITKHSSCAHAATKAARAKCRRLAAKRDAS